MTMDNPMLFEVAYVPVGTLPKGRGWRMYSGNDRSNTWYRPSKFLRVVMKAADGNAALTTALTLVMADFSKMGA
jgi:hypothetical protein